MHFLSKLFGLSLLFVVIFGTTSNGQTIINIISAGDAGPTSGTNWSISGTTLTATGAANIQASVIENALSSGNLTIVSGTGSEYMIVVNDQIEYTGATERTLTFGATHRVLVYENISSTSAALNIILASEFDRASGFTGGGFGVGVFSAITTNGGDVWIGGGQLTGSWNGHTVGVGAAMGGGGANGVGAEITNSTISTAGGDVRILGTSNGLPGINAYGGNSTINAGAGNIELISDRMGFDFSGSQGDIQIDGTGYLALAPLESSFANAVTWDGTESGNYYTSAGGANTIDGLKIKNTLGLTIGKSSNTVDVTIASAVDIAGPITVYGGDIAVNENLNTTAGGALGDMLLKASGNITQAASKSITTSGGDVTLWADSDGNGTGYIQLTGGSSSGISSGGGNVFLGGGTDLATGYARGAAVIDSDPSGFSFYIAGVHLRNETEINSGGGNITLRGQNVGNSAGHVQPGIMGIGTTLDAGTGKIALYGLAGGSGIANAQAISTSAAGSGWTIRSASTEADAITLIGDATSTNSSATSLGINFAGIIEATGNGGGIALTGTSGTSTSFGDGLGIVGDVLAASGTITITGTDDATNVNNRDVFIVGATLGSKTATNVTSSTANVVVRGNRPAFASNVAVNTSGTFTLEPAGDDFTSAITYPITDLTLDAAVSGLTIGKSSSADGTSDADVTVGSATTIAGPITIYGGTITLNADLTTTNSGDISFYTNNALGGLSAARNLTAAGSFKYIPGGNSFVGSVTYPITNLNSSVNGLVIGKSTNTANITIAGAVSVTGPFELYGGALALNENVSCSNMVLDGDTSTLAAGKYINATGNFTHEGPVTLVATSGSNYAQLKVDGTISGSGSVTQEQYTSAAGYHFVSSPFAAAAMSTLGDNVNNVNVFDWDETAYDWVGSQAANNMGVAEGYIAFFGNLGIFSNTSGPWIFDLSGAPNTSVSPTLENTTDPGTWTDFNSNPAGNNGWNLVGNPFTCSLDFSTLSRTDVANSFYIYNDGTDAWESYSGAGGTSALIPPMKAVFIQANGASPSIGTLDMATHGSVAVNPAGFKANMERIKLIATHEDVPTSDDLVFADISMATEGFDPESDAWQMGNGGNTPNLFSFEQGESMTANGLPLLDGTHKMLHVHFRCAAPGQVEISLDSTLTNAVASIELEDLFANNIHDLTQSAYAFTHDTTNIAGRFILHVNRSTIGLEEALPTNYNAWFTHGQLNIDFDQAPSGSVKGKVIDIQGRTVLEFTEPSMTRMAIRTPDLAPSTYIIQLSDSAQEYARIKVIKEQ